MIRRYFQTALRLFILTIETDTNLFKTTLYSIIPYLHMPFDKNIKIETLHKGQHENWKHIIMHFWTCPKRSYHFYSLLCSQYTDFKAKGTKRQRALIYVIKELWHIKHSCKSIIILPASNTSLIKKCRTYECE